MQNVNLIRWQPRWRVAVVARVAQMLGILVHVEGIPFGSSRTMKKVEFDNRPISKQQAKRFAELGKEGGWKSQ